MADWVTILATGLIGGAGSQILGAALTGRREKQKDRRERDTRTLHNALDVVYVVMAGFDNHRPSGGWDLAQGSPELDETLRELRKAISLISHPDLRERFAFILRALGYTSAIGAFSNYTERSAGRALCQYGADMLTACIHQERLPPEAKNIKEFRRALAEADEVTAEYYAERSDASSKDGRLSP
jgi:hypothetical protein